MAETRVNFSLLIYALTIDIILVELYFLSRKVHIIVVHFWNS